MRIPSQFNDSNLYRPRRGDEKRQIRSLKASNSQTRRRLIRLSVGLLLALVVMRQARQPGMYSAFFEPSKDGWVNLDSRTEQISGQLSDPIPAAAAAIANAPRRSTTVNRVSAFQIPPAVRRGESTDESQPRWQDASTWVEAMDLGLQRAWIKTLVHLESASTRVEPVAETPDNEASPLAWTGLGSDDFDRSIELLQSIASNPAADEDLSEQERNEQLNRSEQLNQIVQAIESMRSFYESGECPVDYWHEISWWSRATMDSLDQAALQRVADGTFWIGSDSDAFYLQLARSETVSANDAPFVGTLPLLQQPSVYQGQTIRISGTLQLAEYKQARQGQLDVSGYWKLWVIPADGGVRPTLLISRLLPDSIAQSIDDQGRWNRRLNPNNPQGEIVVVGRFIKRLPYRSSIGADLAPVVIGRVIATRGATVASSPTAGGGDLTRQNNRGWLIILAAVVVGVLIAALLMYRSHVDVKRARKLRQKRSERQSPEWDAVAKLETKQPGEPN